MNGTLSTHILDALPHPVLLLDADGGVLSANAAAENFLNTSEKMLCKNGLDQVLPFGSPIQALIDQVRTSRKTVAERQIDFSGPRTGASARVDVHVSTLADGSDRILVLLEERSMAEKLDRQLKHQVAARSVTGLAAMLAHEIKNPLSGIRGAAQLLEGALETEDDRALTGLIQAETDRIVAIVDRMEVFSDERPPKMEPVNIHAVLGRVRLLAESGFASHIKIVEEYDPSLPDAAGNGDLLIQIFLNLLKNAAEAIGSRSDGEIKLATAFRPGMRLSVASSKDRVNLPLEISLTDNGGGILEELRPNLFDPFVTTKTNGSGLGLAMVAKIVRDHGGIVEHEHVGKGTMFRVLLPLFDKSIPNENVISGSMETDHG
jgi:two-component system nitrogen regulation sensor histidine kinase GlnL